jgi:hypothetical protein
MGVVEKLPARLSTATAAKITYRNLASKRPVLLALERSSSPFLVCRVSQPFLDNGSKTTSETLSLQWGSNAIIASSSESPIVVLTQRSFCD